MILFLDSSCLSNVFCILISFSRHVRRERSDKIFFSFLLLEHSGKIVGVPSYYWHLSICVGLVPHRLERELKTKNKKTKKLLTELVQCWPVWWPVTMSSSNDIKLSSFSTAGKVSPYDIYRRLMVYVDKCIFLWSFGSPCVLASNLSRWVVSYTDKEWHKWLAKLLLWTL